MTEATAKMDDDAARVRALAGEFGRALVERHRDNPAPMEAFAFNDAPSDDGPWGSRADPWAGQRYSIAGAKGTIPRRGPDRRLLPPTPVPAHTLRFVADAARAFLADHPSADLAEAHWETFCALAMDAMDGAFAILQRRHRGEEWSEAQFAARFGGSAPAAAAPAARTGPKVSIRGLIDHWKARKEKHNPDTAARFSAALDAFATFLKHDDASRVVTQDLVRWGDALKAQTKPKLKAGTINNRYGGAVKACFAAAWKRTVLSANPFAGLGALVQVDANAAPARRGYNDEEAAKVLRAARSAPPTVRWLTWLMAYTGARIVEPSQLYREDVRWASAEEARNPDKCVGIVARSGRKGGVYFLRIDNTGEGQGIKRRATRRDVPLHPVLIEEGFLEFVESVPEGSFLFGDLPMDKHGRKESGSKAYNPWLRNVVGIKYEKSYGISGHSWRHRMENVLRREAKASTEVTDALLGHAHKGGSASYVAPPLVEKAEALFRVPVVELRQVPASPFEASLPPPPRGRKARSRPADRRDRDGKAT